MKTSNSHNGCMYMSVVLFLLLSSNFITACCTYKNHDNIKNFIEPTKIEKKEVVFEIDLESEQKAISAMRVLAEAEYSHYMYVAKKKSYASSIKELGYVHDDNGGSIALKSVWLANIDGEDFLALGATDSEYSLKIIGLEDSNTTLGYIAIAIPLKDNLAMYTFYVDMPQKSIMQAISINVIRIFDLKTVAKLKENLSSTGVIEKSYLEEISKKETKAQIIKDFKLPHNINRIK